ncbi:TPA: serine acetyltransferase, partial [Streptococcus suis]|nr:serine acetyltransferase [Streptococcus suis]
LFHNLNYLIYKLLNSIIVLGFFGSEIHSSRSISDNIILFHPYGIVISADAKIGDGVIIRQQVTIGNKGLGGIGDKSPTIEENVEIGAGAKIIGDITIGAGSKIGANAVVTKSFPANSILVGVPAVNIANKSKT